MPCQRPNRSLRSEVMVVTVALLASAWLPAPAAEPALKRGIHALTAGHTDEAVTSFREHIGATPEDAEGYFWLATTLSELGRNGEAVPLFERSMELNEKQGVDAAQLRVNFGNTLLNMGKTDDSIKQFRRAITVDPAEPRAHFNLARAYLGKEGPFWAALAMAALSKSENLGLKLPGIHKFRAEACVRLHMPDKAREHLKLYLSEIPDSRSFVETRLRVNEMLEKLSSVPPPPTGPVPQKRRRYILEKGQNYVIVTSDSIRKTLTLVSEDAKDPDGGLQDGGNDGFFEMPIDNFEKQSSGGASIWFNREAL